MAVETIVIDISTQYVDRTSEGFSKSTSASDRFSASLEKTKKWLDKVGDTKCMTSIEARDKASSVVQKAMAQIDRFKNDRAGITIDAVDYASSKVNSIWSKAKNLTSKGLSITVSMIDKITSPLQAVYRFVTSIQGVITGLIANAAVQKFVVSPTQMAISRQNITTAFSNLLGSDEAAEQRVTDLTAFAGQTPYTRDEIFAASRILQVFTGDALATADGLKLVGDVASGTQQDFTDMATWMGRLYTGMQSGKPIGEATSRLMEMGAISGEAAMKMAALSEAVADGSMSFDDAWVGTVSEFSRFDGMMEKMSDGFQNLLLGAKSFVTNNIWQRIGSGIIKGFTPALQRFRDWRSENKDLIADMAQGIEDNVAKVVSKVSAGVESIFNVTSKLFRDPVFQNASFGGKAGMLWDEIIGDPFKQWWENGGKEDVKQGVSKIAKDVADILGDLLKEAFDIAYSNPITGTIATAWIAKNAIGLTSGAIGGIKSIKGGISGGIDIFKNVKSVVGNVKEQYMLFKGISDSMGTSVKETAELMDLFNRTSSATPKILDAAGGSASGAAGKFSIASGAIGGAGGAIAALAPVIVGGIAIWGAYEATIGQTKRAYRELFDENDKVKSSIKDLSEAVKDHKISASESLLGASAEDTRTYADMMFSVLENEEQSVAKKEKMNQLVDIMNGKVSDLGLSYDEVTDKINLSKDAIYDKIAAMEKEARIAAIKGMIEVSVEDQIAAMKNISDINKQIEETKSTYEQAMERATVDGFSIDALIASAQLGPLQRELESLEKSKESAMGTYDSLKSESELYTNLLGLSSDQMNEFTEKVKGGMDMSAAFSEVMGNVESSAKNAAENVGSVRDEADKLYASLDDSSKKLYAQLDLTTAGQRERYQANGGSTLTGATTPLSDNGIYDEYKKIGEGAVEGLKKGASSGDIENVFTPRFQKMIENDKSTTGVHSPSIVYEDMAEDCIKGFGNGVSRFDWSAIGVISAQKMLASFQIMYTSSMVMGANIGIMLQTGLLSKSALYESAGISMASSINNGVGSQFSLFIGTGAGAAINFGNGMMLQSPYVYAQGLNLAASAGAGFIAGLGILGSSEDIVTGMSTSILSIMAGLESELVSGWVATSITFEVETDKMAVYLVNRVNVLASDVLSILNSVRPSFHMIGAQYMIDLTAGIESQRGAVVDEASSIVQALMNTFITGLGIHSPAKKGEWVGQMYMLGIAKGLNPDQAEKFALNVIDKMQASFENGKLNVGQTVDKLGDNIPALVAKLGVDPEQAASMLYPLVGTAGTISDYFGNRESPGGIGSTNHQGLDIAAPTGTPIDAVLGGLVTIAGDYGGYGNAVQIDHGNGVQTLYGHMSAVNVSPGQQVSAGQIIGAVGSTGNSTGPHLHLSVLQDGVMVDPLPYIQGAPIAAGNTLAGALMAEYNRRKYGASFGMYSGGGDIESWIAQALAITGQPMSLLSGLVTAVMAESGGDPNAINDWDSNAAAGTPSKGLMQTIDSTFNAYHLDGYDNIWDPVSNLIAAIRYMISRYGSVEAVLNDRAGGWYGYANGGVIDSPKRVLMGEAGSEIIIPLSAGKRKRGLELLSVAQDYLGVGDDSEYGNIISFPDVSNKKDAVSVLESRNVDNVVPFASASHDRGYGQAGSDSTDQRSENTSGVVVQVGGVQVSINVDASNASNPQEIANIVRSEVPGIANQLCMEIAQKLAMLFSGMPNGRTA